MTDRSARTTTPEPTTAPSTSARLRLALLLGPAALLAACSSAPPQRSYPQPLESDSGPSSRLSDEQASSIAIHALGLVGTPYRYGGNTPDGGFDCSGLIQYAIAGITNRKLPRTTSQWATLSAPMDRSDLQRGDFVFFNTLGGRYSHMGIYAGNNQFVHAPSSGGVVKTVSMANPYFAKRFTEGRTVFEGRYMCYLLWLNELLPRSL